ncbi:MAG: hypothetical protein PHE96_04335 [Methylococcales bacterium]|nr:hypothetical protein [Methylococcales bacterium]
MNINLGFKLQARKIAIESVRVAWENKNIIINLITLPALFFVISYALWVKYQTNYGIPIMILVFAIFCLVCAWFTITCHRFILVRDSNSYKNFNFKVMSIRVLKFSVIACQVYAALFIVKAVVIFIMIFVFHIRTILNDSESINYWIHLPSELCALYILGRLSLVFPATATDKKVSLKWSWVITRGNSWGMFFIVGLIPLILTFTYDLFWHESATTIEKTAISLVYFFILIIETFALSITYREFESYYLNKSTKAE